MDLKFGSRSLHNIYPKALIMKSISQIELWREYIGFENKNKVCYDLDLETSFRSLHTLWPKAFTSHSSLLFYNITNIDVYHWRNNLLICEWGCEYFQQWLQPLYMLWKRILIKWWKWWAGGQLPLFKCADYSSYSFQNRNLLFWRSDVHKSERSILLIFYKFDFW